MNRRVLSPLCLAVAILVAGIVAAGAQSRDQAPKRGGILTSLIIEDPPTFLIHAGRVARQVKPV